MKTITLFIALSIFLPSSLLISGCGRLPNAQEISQMESQIGPYPRNYQEQIKAYFLNTLKDPYSAHYDFDEEPVPGYLQSSFGHVVYGWVGVVWVNAKNSFGAYTGRKPYSYVIKNGYLIEDSLKSYSPVIPFHPNY